jgi:putative ABC transport system permease protein
MTTVGTKGTRTDRPDGSPSTRGRFARWLASWRVAIRIAHRDARRYKWRSALIVVMVGLPVLLLTSGIVLVATNNVSLAESVPPLMGSAQARIAGDSSTSTVQRLTGGTVIQVVDGSMRITQGDRRPSILALGIDGRDPIARGMTELVSGRWARTSSEIVVTEAGIAGGLPPEGTLTAGPEGTKAGPDSQPRELRVVGVATAQTRVGMPFLVALPELVGGMTEPESSSSAFLLGRANPVTWSDVRALRGHGLLVQSREVFQSPPSDAEPDPMSGQSTNTSDQRQLDLVLLLATACLFIETTLLAGPAFAVSAARQRRSLALAASNGAEARQLRRYVLGQALVLGVASAAIAAVAGVLLALAGLTWWKAGHPDFVTGPFEVSWPQVVGVLSCSAVASMVAALLPARGIARLDIVSVLAGRSGDRKIHRGLPVVGVVLMVGSGVAIIWSVASADGAVHGPGGETVASWSPSMSYFVAGAGLVLGGLMVIPAMLALVGRLCAPLVLPLRLAARDTARQRGRSTPAVASIMAAVATLTALSIGAASDTRQKQDAYKPSRPMGTGSITFNSDGADERDARAVLARSAPQLIVHRAGFVAASPAVRVSRTMSWVELLPPGCTETQIRAGERPGGGIADCPDGLVMVEVGDLPSLSMKVPLLASQRAVLQQGGILIANPKLIHDGKVRFVGGREGPEVPGAVPARERWITQRTVAPAVVVDPRIMKAAFGEYSSRLVWIQADTAAKLGWPVHIRSLGLTSPTGAISPAVESAVADRLGDGYILSVERGFQNPLRLMLLVLFSVTGLLVLVASLISTALSLAESQNDMATLAAVGATRHTRRAVAASQALVVSACGCLLGVAMGMVPGIAVTWPLTTQVVDQVTGLTATVPPVIVIPWLSLAALCVGVPLLAAGFAWTAVRRHPQLTRRTA